MPPAVQILIFAVLAAVVLFQLYNVLGKRVGRQAEDLTPEDRERLRRGPLAKPVEDKAAAEPRKTAVPVFVAPGVEELKAREPSFEPDKFTEGARIAYETIVKAFAAGDLDALRPLLTPVVMDSFTAAVEQRRAEGRTQTTEFLHTPRADLESVALEGDLASARVRFLSELRTRSTGPEGEAVDDRRTAEIWTFQRKAGSTDPNWVLARVEAAQA